MIFLGWDEDFIALNRYISEPINNKPRRGAKEIKMCKLLLGLVGMIFLVTFGVLLVSVPTLWVGFLAIFAIFLFVLFFSVRNLHRQVTAPHTRDFGGLKVIAHQTFELKEIVREIFTDKPTYMHNPRPTSTKVEVQKDGETKKFLLGREERRIVIPEWGLYMRVNGTSTRGVLNISIRNNT